MAIKRTSNNSVSNSVKLSTGFSSAAIPNTPTIGTATATSDVAATVEYTAAVLGATGSTFTATSSPGSVTGTGSSPITVTGLTASTAYTFTVTAGNANGTSSASSASNSITTSDPLAGFYSIASHTFTGSTNTITFSSIPQIYRHLQINITAKIAENINSGYGYILATINGDTGSNYVDNRLVGRSNSSFAGATAYTNSLWLFGSAVTNGASLNNFFGVGYLKVSDYTKTDRYKEWFSLNGLDNNGIGESDLGKGSTWIQTAKWKNTAAINSIKLDTYDGNNFVNGSVISIYGII